MRPEIKEALWQLRFTRFLNSRMWPKVEKGFCKWCGGKLPKYSRVWCSDECRGEAYVRMGFFIHKLLARDKGFCVKCGIDTVWLAEQIKQIKRTNRKTYPISDAEFRQSFGPWWTVNYRYWEADHIVPVYEGGGCCGLDNYQTLCLRCHKEKSAKLAKRKRTK